MRMTDFVVKEAICPGLKADTKEGVLREMVGHLRAAGRIKPAAEEGVVQALLKRESLGSTGIGRGVAIPCRSNHAGFERLIATLAVSRAGVEFGSLDGEPVHVFVMLISPPDRQGDYLRAQENVSRSLRDDNFVRDLRLAGTREAIWELLEAQWDHVVDAGQAGGHRGGFLGVRSYPRTP
jgi:mannitol/fructose-specific phosphotransferase system IIA component (Ntr-type)